MEYKKNTTSLKKFEYLFDLANHRLLEKRHHSGGAGDNYDLDSIYRSVQVKAGVADPVLEQQTPGSQTVTSTTAVTYDPARKRSAIDEATTAGSRPKFPYDSKPVRDLTNDILNNRASREALSHEQRNTLARFYEETSKTVKTEAQRLFNVDRARYLRGEIDTPPGLLNDWKTAYGFK